MKKHRHFVASEEVKIENAKAALLHLAPFFSILEEKLREIDAAYSDIMKHSSQPMPESTLYYSFMQKYERSVAEIESAAQINSNAFKTALKLMNTGMRSPGFHPEYKELETSRANDWNNQIGLAETLNNLSDSLDGNVSSAAYKLQDRIKNCVSYISGTILPEMDRCNFNEHLFDGAWALNDGNHRKNTSRISSLLLAAGLLAGSNGILSHGHLHKPDLTPEALIIMAYAFGQGGYIKYATHKDRLEAEKEEASPFHLR